MEEKQKSFSLNLFSRMKSDIRNLLIAGAVVIAALLVTGLYYKSCYSGLKSRDAIDIAQIAANMSEGHGFTTRFVRPSNAVYFQNLDKFYPELNHGPLYPASVALIFKARSISEQAVTWTSIAFFLLTLAAVYVLGKMLFDRRVGLLATGLFALSEPVLNSAISGEQWTLCAFLFTSLLIAMAAHHAAADSGRLLKVITLAVVSAGLTAALYMTNPIMVFIAIPTAVYFGFTGSMRRQCLGAYVIASAVFIAPWAIRNATLTGIPILGITGWDIAVGTSVYPGDTFYRTADVGGRGLPALVRFPIEHFGTVTHKIAVGAAQLTGSLMSVLGYFAAAFAVVGMLYKFRSNTANAMRGYVYGAIPLMIVCFAAYGTDNRAVQVFTPLASVLATAYFMLLLDAKKLHSFFVKLLIGGLLFVTAFPALTKMLPGSEDPVTPANMELQTLLARPGFNQGVDQTPVYTDVPWMVAWRTKSVGVWLPVSDADYQILSGVPLPLNVVLLTQECEKYESDEIWYALHMVPMWRTYIKNPEQGLGEIMKASNITVKQFPDAPKEIERMMRRFKAADSIKGFASIPQFPLQPDRIQIFVRSEAN